MTLVKICGIKSEEVALGAAEAGADLIGVMFANSPRQVTPDVAAKITAALKNKITTTTTVGVFVNTSIATVQKIAEMCRLDWVQLSGDESWEYCKELGLPVIKVVKFNGTKAAETQIIQGKEIMGNRQYMILLDTVAKDKYGGTGEAFDWDTAIPITQKHEVIIAGGLNPENVGEAIKMLKPRGVDVSTGVETNGKKDMDKIIKFIEAVRKADDSQT